MERKFLLYLLYSALIDIRARSYENDDRTSFWLCDLLHNVPLSLSSDQDVEHAYAALIEKVEFLGVKDWLDSRREEFLERFPEYRK